MEYPLKLYCPILEMMKMNNNRSEVIRDDFLERIEKVIIENPISDHEAVIILELAGTIALKGFDVYNIMKRMAGEYHE